MKALGISPLDKDSTVSLLEDGRVVYSAAEERFTRVKLQNGFPWQALTNALDTTGTALDEIDVVSYPFFTWREETRLFERGLAAEREFLQTPPARTASLVRQALSRVPARTTPVPGLRHPNERIEKGLAKELAYRILGLEGVVSRNVARHGSEQWGREAKTFHRQ